MTKHYILQALNADGKSVYIDDVPNGKIAIVLVRNVAENLSQKTKAG